MLIDTLAAEIARLKKLLKISSNEVIAAVEKTAAVACTGMVEENEKLRAELRRVAPFLASHGVAGYRLEIK